MNALNENEVRGVSGGANESTILPGIPPGYYPIDGNLPPYFLPGEPITWV